MRFNYIKNAPMLFSGSVEGITGMDTPGITQCTVNNAGFYVCNNSVEDMQYPSYSTGNGRDVVWEGKFRVPFPLASLPYTVAHILSVSVFVSANVFKTILEETWSSANAVKNASVHAELLTARLWS